jgi:hypothetical protein
MPSNQAVVKELEDLEVKADNAREVAARPAATARDKSDLKIIEQELMAAQNQAKHADHATRQERKPEPTDPVKKVDLKLDAALKESFPGSDPVSMVQAAPVTEHDAELPSVKAAEHQQPEKTAKAKRSQQ